MRIKPVKLHSTHDAVNQQHHFTSQIHVILLRQYEGPATHWRTLDTPTATQAQLVIDDDRLTLRERRPDTIQRVARHSFFFFNAT